MQSDNKFSVEYPFIYGKSFQLLQQVKTLWFYIEMIIFYLVWFLLKKKIKFN